MGNPESEMKIVKDNGKYRIKFIKAPFSQVLAFTTGRGGCLTTLTVSKYSILQKRKWFFGWYWKTQERTNSSQILVGWIDKYFKKGRHEIK